MEFSRGVSRQEGKTLKLQESWLPVTPAKPIPTKTNPTMDERWVNQQMGLPTEFLQGNPSISNGAAPFVNQNMGLRNWESSNYTDQRNGSGSETIPSTLVYQQGANSGNQMGMWNNLPFTDLLALANSGSGVSTSPAPANVGQSGVGQRGGSGGSIRNFPFHLPENDNNNFQSNSANMFVMPDFSISSSLRIRSNNPTHPTQMSHYGTHVPYDSTYSPTPATTVYDLNSPPIVVNQVSSRNTTFQCTPATQSITLAPNRDDRMRQNHVSHGHRMSNGNVSFEFASPTPVSNDNVSFRFDSVADTSSKMQQTHNMEAISNANTTFDVGSRMQGNYVLEATRNGTAGSTIHGNQVLEATTHCNTSFELGNTMQQNHVLEPMSNGDMSFGFHPLTPNKGTKMQQHRHSELLNTFEDKRVSNEKNMLQVDANPTKDNYVELDSSQDSCLEVMVNSPPPTLGKSSSTSVELKENHQLQQGAQNGIDLNKTPQQKPKRKKHRPRVVREGNTKKATPKSTEKQANMNDTQRVKRKYVRKKDKNLSGTPSTDIVADTNNTDQHNVVRSCKRSLNFDQKDQNHESQQESHKAMLNSLSRTMSNSAFNGTIESQVPDICTRDNITRDKDNCAATGLQFSQGLEVMVQDSFGLNSTVNQILDEQISPHDRRPQPTRRGLLRENIKVLARESHTPRSTARKCPNSESNLQEINQPDAIGEDFIMNHDSFVPSGLQRNTYAVSSCKNSLNYGQPSPLSDSRHEPSPKRTHAQIINGCSSSLDQFGNHFNSLQVYHDLLRANQNIASSMLSQEIYKKRRITIANNTQVANIPNSQRETIMQHRENDRLKLQREAIIQNQKNDHLKLSTSQWKSQHLNAGECFPRNGANTLRNQGNALMQEYSSLAQSSGNIGQMQTTPSKPLSSRIESHRTSFGEKKASEVTPSIHHNDNKGRKRSKGDTQIHNLPTLTAVTQCYNLQSVPPENAPMSQARRTIGMFQATQHKIQSSSANNPANMATNKYSMTVSSGSMVSFSSTNDKMLQKDQASAYGYRQYTPRGTQKIVEQLRLIEDIVRRLASLNLGAESNMSPNEQNALVPFKGVNQIVPYEGYDLTKKRRPRPKVDLDSETDRVWKLLMGKEANEGIEGNGEDKEKWWEEERRVFSGRADSFIARMHLIQGDRRFTKWNGSVLDSVIGVFLTQNVSDHLSSSAFMSLAARFPLKSTSDDRMPHKGKEMYVEEPEVEVIDLVDSKWHENLPYEPVRSQDSQGSNTLHEVDHIDDKEIGNSSLGSNTGGCFSSGTSDKDFGVCQQAPNTSADIQTTRVRCTSFVEASDGRVLEVESRGSSPQNSVDSSVFQVTVGNTVASKETATFTGADRRETDDVVSSKNDAHSFIHKEETTTSILNCQLEDSTTMCNPIAFNNCTSFMDLLRTTMFPEYYNPVDECVSVDLNSNFFCNQSDPGDTERMLNPETINAEDKSFCFLPSSSEFQHTATSVPPSSNYCLQVSPNTGLPEVRHEEMIAIQNAGETSLEKMAMNSQAAGVGAPYSSIRKQSVDLNISLVQEVCCDEQPSLRRNTQLEINQTCQLEGKTSTEPEILHTLDPGRNDRVQQHAGTNFSREKLDVVESTSFIDKKQSIENADAESIMTGQVHSSKSIHENTTTPSKPKGKPAKEKNKEFDWDYLRKEAYQKCGKREKNCDTRDSLDWEAVRCANVHEIADAIKERGMNNMLAERIKDFLNRLVREHGSIDLEWLRDVPPDKAKEYLLSVRGLGLKSVECIRLLTLHHLAFPVDTNVGRIAVRLGWVPLQPLPESVQLHLLEMYPILESIQKYLWPRLCTLDQRTLYELHYQLITFGKVFCTKSKPNCNACPMRAECKHFASAFASARLALPAPEEKGIVSSTVPPMPNQNTSAGINPSSTIPGKEGSTLANYGLAMDNSQMSLPSPKENVFSEARTMISNSEPIVEVPASPESNEIPESDIEDAFWEDPDEIPEIKLSMEDFALNLQNYMQENKMELKDGDMSKALVALNPQAASIPTPKLKNVGRLRTEHQVYELPDSHPLLKEMEKRVPGEVSSYLLAIWTPGETTESVQPPEGCCNSQISGNLCSEQTCFSCNSIRETNSQTVRGTILIPCKTAMRGSFPLNGTYFQVNEVFADHDSSLNPIDVPRAWLWNLSRRTVYFGTSVPTIFRGQSTEQIQSCFWRGFVCVRGFDRKTRAPRPLIARLHFPASKLAARKKAKKDE